MSAWVEAEGEHSQGIKWQPSAETETFVFLINGAALCSEAHRDAEKLSWAEVESDKSLYSWCLRTKTGQGGY